MIQNQLDITQNYFYMPFGPMFNENCEEYGLEYIRESGMYYQKKTNTTWQKVLLYDTGWGQPSGYERLPVLTFDSLMLLALKSDSNSTKLKPFESESNKYGAIAIIMERYISDLISFLKCNINNREFISNPLFLCNLKAFCFDDSLSKGNGGLGNRSYESILNDYEEWKQISKTVKEIIYK